MALFETTASAFDSASGMLGTAVVLKIARAYALRASADERTEPEARSQPNPSLKRHSNCYRAVQSGHVRVFVKDQYHLTCFIPR